VQVASEIPNKRIEFAPVDRPTRKASRQAKEMCSRGGAENRAS